MDFSLTDEQKMIQQTVRRFVERELMPLENEVLAITRVNTRPVSSQNCTTRSR